MRVPFRRSANNRFWLTLMALTLGLAWPWSGETPRAFAAPLLNLPGIAKPVTSSAPVTPDVPEEKVATDSPRAAVTDFTRLTRAGNFVKASRYLDLSSVDPTDGPTLAQHLNEVLARHLWLDLDKISPTSLGKTDDGLPSAREELGQVPGVNGAPEPVVLVRHADREGARWVFSSTTVQHIEGWYDHLESRWLLEHLPKSLLRFGPRELRWWQWLALGPLLLVSWLCGLAITRVSRTVIRRVTREHATETARRLRGPAILGWTVIVAYLLLPWLGLYEPASAFVQRFLSAGLLLALFWALWKAVELSQHAVSTAVWATNSLTARSLLMLAARVGKLVVAAFAFVAVLAELGYPVTSIITGLGIGGIALALAAQKTVENLFGAFSLAIDRPFREGDVIQVDSVSGTVEAIGLRSTRIRTLDRTLISIPNGKLAEMRIETVSVRDQLRLSAVLALAHAPSERLREIVSGIESLLRLQDLVDASSVSVRFVALTDAGMNLEVGAMLRTRDFSTFLDVRQAVFFELVAIVERAGGAFAHPTRTLEFDSERLRALRTYTPT